MIILMLTLLGLCFGSFVNALVWRLHKQEEEQTVGSRQLVAKKAKKSTKLSANSYPLIAKDLSILKGRSMCVHCKHVLAWYDLFPVISWISLLGKCRYCHKPISCQYPIVELATAFLFVFSYLFWPSILHSPFSILQFCMWLVFLVGFMALIVYDLRWMLLPDRIVKPLQLLAGIYVLNQAIMLGGGWSSLLGAAIGVLCSAGLFYLLYQISDGRWIGGGDVKLAVVLGLILGGPLNILLMIFIASSIGSILAIPLIILGKARQNTRIPFGPLLIVATCIVYLFGAVLAEWYKKQFLLF
ncbi:MAG: prepilin peptidase [Patescibacteria group bacterium]